MKIGELICGHRGKCLCSHCDLQGSGTCIIEAEKTGHLIGKPKTQHEAFVLLNKEGHIYGVENEFVYFDKDFKLYDADFRLSPNDFLNDYPCNDPKEKDGLVIKKVKLIMED